MTFTEGQVSDTLHSVRLELMRFYNQIGKAIDNTFVDDLCTVFTGILKFVNQPRKNEEDVINRTIAKMKTTSRMGNLSESDPPVSVQKWIFNIYLDGRIEIVGYTEDEK